MKLMRWLMRSWSKGQRQIDIEILWPSLCRNAPDAATARRAFFVHATRDPAWAELSDDEVVRIVEGLLPPEED